MADNNNKWLEAMEKELITLKENDTWTVVSTVPKDSEIVISKWVFKVKRVSNGEFQYKARLVARGFEQADWDLKMYAPVAWLPTFRLFLAIANKKRLPVHQMDVTGAFLYGKLKNEVFMKLPDKT